MANELNNIYNEDCLPCNETNTLINILSWLLLTHRMGLGRKIQGGQSWENELMKCK